MKRPTRDQMERPLSVAQVTASDALRFESDGWPSSRLRREWWNGDHVPPELRNHGEPDPRRVLGGMTGKEYDELRAAWQTARLEWLRQEVA